MTKIICTVINDLTYDQRMHRICSTLANAGYQVTLVGRQLPASLPLLQQNFKQKRLKCLINSGKLFYLEYNFRLFLFLLRQSYDMVCSVDLDTLVAGFCCAKVKKKISIFDAHEYFQEVPEVVNRPFTKWVWEKVANLIIPKVKYCYTVSPGLADIFTKKYGPSFSTILNAPAMNQAIREEANVPLPATENKILLYQGALNEGRGLEVAIRAVADLQGIEFWLAGEGDLSTELRELVEELNLATKVRFLGYVLPDQLKALTPKAFLGYNLLENKGLSYYYSLANKFFDYIHAGVPTLNPAFPEYIAVQSQHDVSVLINQLTSEVLKSEIISLLADQKRYVQLKANCVQAARAFNWENEQAKLLEIYSTAENEITT